MKKKSKAFLFWVLFCTLGFWYIVYAIDTESVIRYLVWDGWATHNWWLFRWLSTNEDGNTGIIRFWEQPTDPGYSWAMTVGNTLTGYLWIDTIWWVGLNNAEILPPTSNNPVDPWIISWYGWSDNAGWIDFSNTLMYPDTFTLSWYAWNDGIGWIPMAGSKLGTISDGIVKKVKILWSIGGSLIFDTPYDVGESFGSVTMTTFIDKVRKNVALLSRNVPSNFINTDFSTTKIFENKMIYIRTDGPQQIVKYSTIKNIFVQSPIQSLIVIGADVYIDEDILPINTTPRAIIALADSTGNQGNIYVWENVKKIQSSLVAEWSLYSGFLPSTPPIIAKLYNPDVISTMTLPENQLYIYGTIISHNTIGWSAQDGTAYACPYTEPNCDRDHAVWYDLNFFRWFNKDDLVNINLKRAYPTSIYDDFSMIIEYNPLIQSNPPPGLYDIKQ